MTSLQFTPNQPISSASGKCQERTQLCEYVLVLQRHCWTSEESISCEVRILPFLPSRWSKDQVSFTSELWPYEKSSATAQCCLPTGFRWVYGRLGHALSLPVKKFLSFPCDQGCWQAQLMNASSSTIWVWLPFCLVPCCSLPPTLQGYDGENMLFMLPVTLLTYYLGDIISPFYTWRNESSDKRSALWCCGPGIQTQISLTSRSTLWPIPFHPISDPNSNSNSFVSLDNSLPALGFFENTSLYLSTRLLRRDG